MCNVLCVDTHLEACTAPVSLPPAGGERAWARAVGCAGEAGGGDGGGSLIVGVAGWSGGARARLVQHLWGHRHSTG